MTIGRGVGGGVLTVFIPGLELSALRVEGENKTHVKNQTRDDIIVLGLIARL